MSGTGQAQPSSSGDFREYTSGGSDATTWASVAADYVQVIGAGSTVVKTEAGNSRTITTDAAEAAVCIKVPILALVSTTATRVRLGYGLPPPLPPALFPSLPAGSGGAVVALGVANVSSLSGLAVTVDGVALSTVGMRVALWAQTTASQNGIWVVQSGAWTRPNDWISGSTIALGTQVTVAPGGTANFAAFGSTWYVTTSGVVDAATIAAFPKICKGVATLSSASPSTVTVSNLWIVGTVASGLSSVALTNTTTAADGLKGVLTAGAGSGTLVITGPNTVTDVVSYIVANG